MGEVYQATDTKLEREVAIKILPATMASNPEHLRRFQREARAVAALNHPNIVTIHSVEEDEGVHFITMECVAGKPLDELIPRQGLAAEKLLGFGVQLAEALSIAHAAGVTHRDLKPANVMVTAEGTVKVLDFGLAKLQPAEEATEQLTKLPTLTMTRAGVVMGTAPYMSPEQIEAAAIDHRTDIFSLGILLYEMATGSRPFQGASSAAIVSSILRDTPTRVTEIRSGLPEQLGVIIERCLEKKPENRLQLAQDLQRELEAVQQAVDSGQGVVSRLLTAALALPRSRWIALVATLIILALLVGLWIWQARLPPSEATPPKISSLAVLPLLNLSGDPEQDYFVDGMTAALINNLARVSALKVISRTSVMRYKGSEKSLPEIAQELGVDAVVEGSVFRSMERLRISAQLIRASTDEHLWANDYEGDLRDVLALQAGVARAIAQEVEAQLTPAEADRLSSTRSVDPAAYEAYLRGRHMWGKGGFSDLQGALEQFRQAIDFDPSYAAAYAGLAEVYLELGSTGMLPPAEAKVRVRAAARQALEIDPDLAAAYISLAWLTAFWDWEWAESEKLFTRALELNPNDARGYRNYSEYLRCLGRHDEAVRAATRGAELDPFSEVIHQAIGGALYLARRYDEAIAALEETVELPGDSPVTHIFLGLALLQTGEDERGVEELRQVAERFGEAPELLLPLAAGYAAADRRTEARDLLKEVETQEGVSAAPIALVYTQLGESEPALQWLERAYENREWFMACLGVWPQLDPLRSDPRFQDLLLRMNFPEQAGG